MTIKQRIVRVKNKIYTVTISQRSKKAWVAAGDYTGKRIEVVGSSAINAARRWAATARCKGHAEAQMSKLLYLNIIQ